LIQSRVLDLGISVKGIVSDRARALVSLGNAEHLDVVSMPDLFHFVQDMGKLIGCRIGRQRVQALKAIESAKEGSKAGLVAVYERLAKLQSAYREQIMSINKSIHPFDEANQWIQAPQVEKNLLTCFSKIGQFEQDIEVDIDVERADKILAQINPIAKGVEQWVDRTKTKLRQWLAEGMLNEMERRWLESYALPSTYWEIQCRKTQAKARNQDLRKYYKSRATQARQSLICEDIQERIDDNRKEELWKMAHRLAESFQRASSQVEGRNGYLSFINHANRGIPKQRLKVLTVIHNYDVRRADGTTPAQRFFDKEFPDLFEFLCRDVTGFKEPRKGRHKSLSNSCVQR